MTHTVIRLAAVVAIIVMFHDVSIWLCAALVLAALVAPPYASGHPRLVVVYDGGCGLCRRSLAVLLSIDWANRIESLSLTEWENVMTRFPQLDRPACVRDMHAVDGAGRTHAGYEAYQKMAWRLPLLAPFAWLMYVPPIPQIGRRIYRRVADNRLRDQSAGCPR